MAGAGPGVVGKVYEFSFSGRELALRPELTASVLRAYVGRLQDQPLPLRLRYAGPVFRNERPQRATYRQFTQVGVELIGGPAPRADAECIAWPTLGSTRPECENIECALGILGWYAGCCASWAWPSARKACWPGAWSACASRALARCASG